MASVPTCVQVWRWLRSYSCLLYVVQDSSRRRLKPISATSI